MLKPSMQELMKRVGNRYLLVNLAAQRARDIAEEAEESGEELPDKAVKLALDEIADGEIVYRPGPRVEPVIVPNNPIAAAMVDVDDDSIDLDEDEPHDAAEDGHEDDGDSRRIDEFDDHTLDDGDVPEEGLVPEDLHVLPHVGGGGGDLHELEDVGPGGVLVKDPVEAHLVQHGHRVDGLRQGEHGVDGLVDVPVLLEVEVVGPELFNDGRDAPGVDEHGAQHRLLRLGGVGELLDQKLVVHGGSPPAQSRAQASSRKTGGTPALAYRTRWVRFRGRA